MAQPGCSTGASPFSTRDGINTGARLIWLPALPTAFSSHCALGWGWSWGSQPDKTPMGTVWCAGNKALHCSASLVCLGLLTFLGAMQAGRRAGFLHHWVSFSFVCHGCAFPGFLLPSSSTSGFFSSPESGSGHFVCHWGSPCMPRGAGARLWEQKHPPAELCPCSTGTLSYSPPGWIQHQSTTVRQQRSGPWASCCTTWSWGSTNFRTGQEIIWGWILFPRWLSQFGSSSLATGAIPEVAHVLLSCSPPDRESMGKFRPSSGHTQHGLGMGTEGQLLQLTGDSWFLSPECQDVIKRCLSMQPSDRPSLEELFWDPGVQVGSRGLAGNSSTHLLVISGKANQTGFQGSAEGTRSSWAGTELETWCGKHRWPPSPLVLLVHGTLTAWAHPREGEGAPGEAVPGGAAAAGDSEDNIKDDNLLLHLVSGRLKMRDFDSDTFSKARLHREFADESTHSGMLPDLGTAQPGQEPKVSPFAGADAADPSVAARLFLAGLGAWVGYKMGPPAPTVPWAGAGLWQPARHKQTPMVGAEVGLQSLCRGCFALQARKGLGCSTALVCFGITMGAVQGEGRKPGLPSPMGGFFPGMQGAWEKLRRGWAVPLEKAEDIVGPVCWGWWDQSFGEMAASTGASCFGQLLRVGCAVAGCRLGTCPALLLCSQRQQLLWALPGLCWSSAPGCNQPKEKWGALQHRLA
ncbi:hypothetical protein DV515_00018096, partial [Chloebia gouldiae]